MKGVAVALGNWQLATNNYFSKEISMLRKTIRHQKSKSQRDRSRPTAGPDAVAALSLDSGVVVLSLSLPVTLKGVPQVLVNGVGPLSATQEDPTTIRLTYDTPAAGGDDGRVPVNDPAVRTRNGGYLASAMGAF